MSLSEATDTSKIQIYHALRRAIIMGRITQGERLVIADLVQQHGTSITPVRDALQMLSQEGLVTIKPRSGYFVTRISLKELRDMLDLRKILELASLERLVGRISEAELVKLEQLHVGYTGDDDQSYERYTDENRRFHYLLAEASGNHELAGTLGHLLDRLARFMAMRRAGAEMEQIHGRLIDALREGNIGAAREILCQELDESRNSILEQVMEESADSWLLTI